MQKSAANVRKPPRLCENAQEPTRRRIVFSIALSPMAATALFVFRLTKSRRTFYAKIERLCFHTASTHCSRFPHDTGWTAVDPLLTFAPTDESGVLQARGF